MVILNTLVATTLSSIYNSIKKEGDTITRCLDAVFFGEDAKEMREICRKQMFVAEAHIEALKEDLKLIEGLKCPIMGISVSIKEEIDELLYEEPVIFQEVTPLEDYIF